MSTPRLIAVTVEELTLLIRHSSRERPLCSTIPGGRVNIDGSPWVVPLLELWRGVTMQEGAGI